MEIGSLNEMRKIMDEFGVAPNKAFGQNFLLDKGVLSRIARAAGVDKSAGVLEVGPGMGALTDKLCDAGARVVAVEIDGGMLPVLEYTLRDKDNFQVINGDILDKAVRDRAVALVGEPFSVVANLPYYITTPIIMAFLEGDYDLSSMTIMMQKEVAERICAKPNTKSYGILTVCIDYYADVELLFTISPECFYPRPKVFSMLIKLTKRKSPKIAVKDEKLFFKVVRSAFAMRRKTLVNNLKSAFGAEREAIEQAVEACGLDLKVRGESLTIEELGRLSDEIFDKIIE